MSEAGLLAALRDDPDDAASRLIAADWFEDHGDPARAELLRVQLELDRWVPDLERRESLHARRAALLAEHAPRWLGPLHDAAERWTYTQGLFHLTLKASTLLGPRLKDAPALFAQAGVGTVRLTFDADRKGLSKLVASPRLEGITALDLSRNNLTDAEIGGLLEGAPLMHLRRLDLSNNRLGLDSVSRLRRSGVLGRLVTLDLRNNALPAAVLDLLDLEATPHLRDLDLFGNGCDARPRSNRLVNALGMEFVRIPAGTFRMGSSGDETDHRDHEAPVHVVRLTRPYYLARFLTTQEQYERLLGANPAQFRAEPGGTLPVDSVSFTAAVAFCARLGQSDGRTYRLPTEAEWEYACRAGTTTAYWWGGIGSAHDGNFDGTRPYNTRELSPYLLRTTPVGSYPANPWGLFDTHGNLWEWCSDSYAGGYYRASPTDDPPGPEEEEGRRVLRGGSWHSDAPWCRSAYRCSDTEGSVQNWYGFRVLLEAPE